MLELRGGFLVLLTLLTLHEGAHFAKQALCFRAGL